MQNSTKLLCLLAFSFVWNFSMGQGSEKYSVSTEITVDASAPSITINFLRATDAVSYDIFRKDFGGTSWGNAITNLTTGSSYTDNSVQAGKMYEYYIRKNGTGGLVGHGFVTTGIEVAAQHSNGAVLLIIDSTLSASLNANLGMLKRDLAGDGYEVLEYVVSDKVSHQDIKTKIAEIKTINANLESIYILGHVAVPYSGTYCEDNFWTVPPDGHKEGSGDHCGAWPADVYYAVPSGAWNDSKTVVDGTRSFTKNEPNDGKFDEIILPGTVDYNLGRVDLSNLPDFSQSETELIVQYIKKSHDYRHGISKPVQRALIDENFGANANESFGSSGYRSFGAMVGIENINTNDYMTTLKDTQYIVAYGTGPGSFTSAGGIGNTGNYIANKGAAYFNMVFGSFFGNWNVSNNFLRAPLAVENGGLTNAWAGRPNWHFYPMAFNKSAGFCARLTQNNADTYTPGFFANQVHVALMGDPTLRLHMFAPPTDVIVSASDANQTVEVSWTATSAATDGYNVYYSRDSLGPYVRANLNVITGTSYSHIAPHNGKVYYMVRAERLEVTKSGSFFNLSQGAFGEIDNLVNTSIDPILTEVDGLSIYPNPTHESAYIRFNARNGSESLLKVYDVKGSLVSSKVLRGNGDQTHVLDVSNYPVGLYFVKVNSESIRLLVD